MIYSRQLLAAVTSAAVLNAAAVEAPDSICAELAELSVTAIKQAPSLDLAFMAACHRLLPAT